MIQFINIKQNILKTFKTRETLFFNWGFFDNFIKLITEIIKIYW